MEKTEKGSLAPKANDSIMSENFELLFKTAEGITLYLQFTECGPALWSVNPDDVITALKKDMLDPDIIIREGAYELLATIKAIGIKRIAN